MKKYLLTWYGITDLRASLGEQGKMPGPVLGALLSEDYTHVVILGFTHPDKDKNKSDELKRKMIDMENSDSSDLEQFIDLFSNSIEAHDHFNKWLEKQLRILDKND